VKCIKLAHGQLGVTFEKIFGEYLETNPIEITIEDPYMRSNHQIINFLRFCEAVVKLSKQTKRITLITNADADVESKAKALEKLDKVKTSLADYGVTLGNPFLRLSYIVDIQFNPNLHDREIRLSTGWIIKLGRGLDVSLIYKTKIDILL
jgi:ATP-dependent Lon protease